MPKMPVHRPDGIRINRPITSSVTERAPHCRLCVGDVEGGGGGAVSGSYMGWLPQAPVDAVAIEKIVGIEGIDFAVRGHEMDAGALHRADAKVVAVEELHD